MNSSFSRRGGRAKLSHAVAVLVAPGADVMGAFLTGEKYFPNVTLITHEGKQVQSYNDLIKGKTITINTINTIYTDECSLETACMAEVQRLIGVHSGKDMQFYSTRIDLRKVMPQVIKAYLEKFNIGPDWLFLTGKQKDIKQSTSKLGLSRAGEAINKDGYASSLMLGSDSSGHWMRNSAVDNPKFLAITMANFYRWKDVVATTNYAQAAPVHISKAKFLLESRCSSCHTICGGDYIGPDLLDVTDRRDPAWLKRYLKEPEKALAEGDLIAKAIFEKYERVNMPNLNLGAGDIATMISVLATRPEEAKAKTRLEQGAAKDINKGEEHHHHHH